VQLDDKAAAKHLTSDAKALLQAFTIELKAVSTWTAPVLHEVRKAFAEKRELGLGKIAQPLRVAVTGSTISPPIDMTLEMIGRDRVLARLSAAVAAC
jgi:glutamyl-tRNA synthetase